MALPKVSFILTSYNFGPYIKGAIESLLVQRGGYETEVIVVDDCSTDQTAAIVDSIRDSRLRFIRHDKNMGVAPTINEAFSLTSGQYICRFDGDDEWYPWLLEETIPVLENNPQLGFVYGDISMINANGVITVERNNTPDVSQLDKKALLWAMLHEYFIPAPSIVGRRAAWEDAFPLDEDLIFCDFDLALNMMIKWPVGYIDKPLSKYRVHNGNIHTTSFTRQRRGEMSILKSIRALFEKTDLFSEEEQRAVLRAKHLYFAEAYFGLGSMSDARRCYHKALTPGSILRSNGPVRRYLATYMGRGFYDNVKSLYRKIAMLS